MHRMLIALALGMVMVAAGCLEDPASATPTPTPIPGIYATGDLLQGDLAGAGFPDAPPGSAIAILEYRAAGEYVYTLVRPVSKGWAYVYPSGDFVVRMARGRQTFESYRLERMGHVDLRDVRAPLDGTTPRAT